MAPWLDRKKKWIRGQAKPSPEPVVPVEAEPMKCVQYITMRCPSCNSSSVPYYAKSGAIRYHTCKQCGFRFKSIDRQD